MQQLTRSRAALDEAGADAARLRRQCEIQTAATGERRTGLSARLTEFEARLAARPDEEARARARRAQFEQKRDAIDAIGRAAGRAGR